ncbi:MAG TPA: hypothetical protein VJM46_01490, partial [Candidatus Saccharimonadales bacterium]|nr:hypothetical protein [Candidatus Saccharimonadales bacterium]
VRARLPRYAETNRAAIALLGRKDHALQVAWRLSALVAGAMDGLAGSWLNACSEYSPNPRGVAMEGPHYPHPTSPETKRLAGLQLVGYAVSSLHAGQLATPGLVSRAVQYLTETDDPRLNPWLGVAYTITAQYAYDRQEQAHAAQRALTLLRPDRQTELIVLARHLAGQGDGQVKVGRRSRQTRPATFRAEESLYFFNH